MILLYYGIKFLGYAFKLQFACDCMLAGLQLISIVDRSESSWMFELLSKFSAICVKGGFAKGEVSKL